MQVCLSKVFLEQVRYRLNHLNLMYYRFEDTTDLPSTFLVNDDYPYKELCELDSSVLSLHLDHIIEELDSVLALINKSTNVR